MADEKKTKETKEKPAAEKAEAKLTTEAKPSADAKPSRDAKADVPAQAKSDAPKNYSRGEGQKAVTQAYKDNWNTIFGKKKR
jgi:hypothetical protein